MKSTSSIHPHYESWRGGVQVQILDTSFLCKSAKTCASPDPQDILSMKVGGRCASPDPRDILIMKVGATSFGRGFQFELPTRAFTIVKQRVLAEVLTALLVLDEVLQFDCRPGFLLL